MALRKVHDEAAHGRQRYERPGTSMPQLRVDGLLFPFCRAGRDTARSLILHPAEIPIQIPRSDT
uniref:Uncharacterized protein n=1 Tax=Arundo donax TaxID=35708 RepID=A0A0A9D407_ARUDO